MQLLVHPRLAVTAQQVHAAADRIAGKVVRTPTVFCDSLSRLTGAEIFLKLENFQATGAYKERGAANRLALLSADERRCGVVVASSGNHAQAVARHASLLGIQATVVVPRTAPEMKIRTTASWGAEVLVEGDTFTAACARARQLGRERGLIFLHPFDDPEIIAGQGTVALELMADVPDLDVLLLPIGGGGLMAGCAVICKAQHPDIELIGVQTEHYSAAAQRLGLRACAMGGETLADGAAVEAVGALTFAIIRRLVFSIVVLSEHEVAQAIAALAHRAKVVAEGAGALGLGAVLANPGRFAGRRVGVVVSGGNIDSCTLARTLLEHAAG